MAVRERVIAAGADLVDGGAGARFEVEGNGRMIAAFAIRYDGRVAVRERAADGNVVLIEGAVAGYLPDPAL